MDLAIVVCSFSAIPPYQSAPAFACIFAFYGVFDPENKERTNFVSVDKVRSFVAEWEGFEPSDGLWPPRDFQSRPL